MFKFLGKQEDAAARGLRVDVDIDSIEELESMQQRYLKERSKQINDVGPRSEGTFSF